MFSLANLATLGKKKKNLKRFQTNYDDDPFTLTFAKDRNRFF